MKHSLRLLVTLFTILCCTTISGASIQDTQAGVVFEKTLVLEGEISFFAELVAPDSNLNRLQSRAANARY